MVYGSGIKDPQRKIYATTAVPVETNSYPFDQEETGKSTF